MTMSGARWVLEVLGGGHFVKCVIVQPLYSTPETNKKIT